MNSTAPERSRLQLALGKTSSPAQMVSAFPMHDSVMVSQTVVTNQMNHLAVEETAKTMNGSVEMAAV